MTSDTSIAHPAAVPDAAAARAHVHRMWASVADGWAAEAEYVARRSATLTSLMLDRAAPKAGQRVLELACGTGSAGIAAARIPGVHVVLSDVVPAMVDAARRRAHATGLTDVTAKVLDFEQIDEPDNSYDIVLCMEGLMFAADPVRAATEIHRVCRPGGKAVTAVWGPPDANPWLDLVFASVRAELERPVPPPGIPGPFSLSDAGRLRATFRDGGFATCTIEQVDVPVVAGSVEEWWQRTRTLAGPLATILAALPSAKLDAITARLSEAVRPFVTEDGGVRIPGRALLAVATAQDG